MLLSMLPRNSQRAVLRLGLDSHNCATWLRGRGQIPQLSRALYVKKLAGLLVASVGPI